MANLPGMATFPGLNVISADITVSRGITPGVGIVRCQPADGITLRPGSLVLTGNLGVNFPDCLPLRANRRRAKGGTTDHWDIEVLDHRWRWAGGAISGEYNIRLPSGEVEPTSARTPAQLATLLLRAMGETNFNVTRMPTGVWPYVKWEGINPARALASLCDAVACTVCGGEFARVVIWPLGVGAELPGGSRQFRFARTSKPTRLLFVGGPTLYQSKLTLEPVALQSDGKLVPKDNANYKPSGGWGTQLPVALPDVGGTNRVYALYSVNKLFRVSGQAGGGLTVPGAQVTSITQYLLNDYLSMNLTIDEDNRKLPFPAYVEGTYYPYSDAGENVENITIHLGPWKLRAEESLVEFPFPMFGVGDDGEFTDPTLYLATSYRVKNRDGSLVHFTRTRNLGGSGGTYIIRRPEVHDAIAAVYSTDNRPTGVRSTTQLMVQEAEAYLSLFARKFADGFIDDREYDGIVGALPDGKIAQTRFSAGVGQIPKTRAGRLEEFDIYSESEADRRRAEVLGQLKEAAAL